jgi:hypothetical protein
VGNSWSLDDWTVVVIGIDQTGLIQSGEIHWRVLSGFFRTIRRFDFVHISSLAGCRSFAIVAFFPCEKQEQRITATTWSLNRHFIERIFDMTRKEK